MGIDPVTHTPRMDLLDISSVLNSTQLNLSHFLGVQPVVDPEILRLATSLLSSQRQNNQEFIQQNQLQHQHQHQIQSQFQVPSLSIQETTACTTSNTPTGLFLDEAQLMQANVQQFQSSTPTSFSYQTSPEPNEWQYNIGYYEPSMVELSPDFSFPSTISTPSSSPITPLNSSSTLVNSSIEDDRDTYCSDMLNFQIPHMILNVNDIM